MSEECDFCMEGAGMLAEANGLLANLHATMGVGHAYGDGDGGWWRIEVVTGFGDAFSVPIGFCPMCGRELR